MWCIQAERKPNTTIHMSHHRKFREHQICVRLTLPTGTLSFKTQNTISKSNSKGTIHYILKLVPHPFAGNYTSDLFPGQISLFHTVFASYTELHNTVIVSVCPPQWAAVTLYNIAADLCSDRVKHRGESNNRATSQQKRISFYKLIRTQLPFLAWALSPGV